MKKHEVVQSAGAILLVWLAALGVIFVLPDTSTTQKYLFGSVATILTLVVFSVFFGWEKITGIPKSRLRELIREIVFGVQTIFYFYTAYLFWSIVPPVWGVTPMVNGYYVVTWFHLFLVMILITGGVIFYMAISNVKKWYLWRQGPKKQKRRPKGQSALSP